MHNSRKSRIQERRAEEKTVTKYNKLYKKNPKLPRFCRLLRHPSHGTQAATGKARWLKARSERAPVRAVQSRAEWWRAAVEPWREELAGSRCCAEDIGEPGQEPPMTTSCCLIHQASPVHASSQQDEPASDKQTSKT